MNKDCYPTYLLYRHGLMKYGLIAVVFLSAMLPFPAWAADQVVPGSLHPIALDVASVTTGGVAVTAINAGHRSAGAWLQNPKGAAADLCINELGTASGTTSSGNTTCIAAGQPYSVSPGPGPVSVISSDSSHPFSGMAFTE